MELPTSRVCPLLRDAGLPIVPLLLLPFNVVLVLLLLLASATADTEISRPSMWPLLWPDLLPVVVALGTWPNGDA